MARRKALSSRVTGRREATRTNEPRRQRRRARITRSEDGITLVELLIVMPFLLIVTGLVMNTLTTAYAAEARVQATSQSSSQVTLAFIALDTEMRYASDINSPGSDAGNYYVEFDSDWKTNSQGEPLCTGLEYNNSNGSLQQRSWFTGGTVPSGWQVLATGLAKSVSTDPFSLNSSASPWYLSINISSVVASGSSTGTSQSSFTITALNTTSASSNSGVCGGTP